MLKAHAKKSCGVNKQTRARNRHGGGGSKVTVSKATEEQLAVAREDRR